MSTELGPVWLLRWALLRLAPLRLALLRLALLRLAPRRSTLLRLALLLRLWLTAEPFFSRQAFQAAIPSFRTRRGSSSAIPLGLTPTRAKAARWGWDQQ